MAPDYGTSPFTNDPTRDELRVGTPTEDGRSNFRTSVIQLDRPGDPNVFDAKTHAEAEELITRYPAGNARSALGPMLHLVQSIQGHITPDGIAFCSDKVGLTKAQVQAFATFYTMYKRTPTGEYLVSICTNTLCGMLGGDEIFAAVKDELGIPNNGTTADGKITLEHAECLAACDYAPVVTVNYEFFDNQTVGTTRNLVSQLRNGDRPLPSRGAPLCSFKQTERQIAGFFDDDAAKALEANGTGVATEVGVKLAIERGETAPSYSIADQPQQPAASTTAAPATTAPARKAPAKRAPAKAAPAAPAATADTGATGDTGKTGDAAAPARKTASRARKQAQPSQDDAPLETAESDPANQTDPGKGE